MNWNQLTESDQLDAIKEESGNKAVLIFKHSTRCSISSTALNRLERSWDEEEMKEVKPYLLDLIAHRDISNELAEVFDVHHESPQVLIIKDGKCIYNASHLEISYKNLSKEVVA